MSMLLANKFLSTPSARRATNENIKTYQRTIISIHALREEGDLQPDPALSCPADFYPRPPRGGRQSKAARTAPAIDISIHALREEGDSTEKLLFLSSWISIHALREEGDRRGHPDPSGADSISIHALREEGDALTPEDPEYQDIFLSTPSARRATLANDGLVPVKYISIHALREEGDLAALTAELEENHFYPRPPRGGRHGCQGLAAAHLKFLSTPSARRATVGQLELRQGPRDFYPRPPRGGRLCRDNLTPRLEHFYPRPP